MNILEVQDLCKTYGTGETEVHALNHVSFSVRKGEFIAIIGESGSGKSTLLNVIGALDSVTSGRVWIDGQDIFSMPEKKLTVFRRQHIGFIFQSFNLIPELNVEQNITFPLLLDYKKPNQKFVNELLQVLGLSERRKHLPSQLSGGQQQRVALARALVITPDVLLMDEPLSNLDAKLRLEMRIVIRHTQKDVGITTVYVTHDQEEAMAISDTIAVMKDGVIQHVGTPKDIYQRPKNVFVATFIGRTNIIPARVENGSIVFGNGYRVEMDCLKQTAGQEVLCSVRPEEFVISPDGTEGISGVVKEYTYLGLNTHYFVETDDGQKTVEIVEESSIEDELKPGQRVLLQVKKHKINIFNKEGSVNLVRSEAFYEG